MMCETDNNKNIESVPQSIQHEAEKFFKSPEAFKMIEAATLTYAIDVSVDKSIRNYVNRNIYFPGVVILVVLGWLGLRADGYVSNKIKDIEGDIDKKVVEVNDRITKVRKNAFDTLNNVTSEVEDYSKKNADLVDGMNKKYNTLEGKLTNANAEVVNLNELLKKANDASKVLKEQLAVQTSIINSVVVETVHINDREDSGELILRVPSGPEYKVNISVSKITSKNNRVEATIMFTVNGVSTENVYYSDDAKNWYPLKGAEKYFEFKVNKIFHVSGGVKDYVVVSYRFNNDYLNGLVGSSIM